MMMTDRYTYCKDVLMQRPHVSDGLIAGHDVDFEFRPCR